MAEQQVIRSLDDIPVPDELGPVTYEVTPESVAGYLDRVDDPNPWYRDGSPFGGPVAPPAFTANDYVKLLLTKYSNYDVVHTHATHEYLSPVMLGDVLTAMGAVVEKYVRRGRAYIVVESTTSNQEGQTVVKSRNTWLVAASKRPAEGTPGS